MYHRPTHVHHLMSVLSELMSSSLRRLHLALGKEDSAAPCLPLNTVFYDRVLVSFTEIVEKVGDVSPDL